MKDNDLKGRRAAPLHTPTDLSSNATRDVAAALNLLLADAFALYIKTKNFHWHMSGPHFRDYHLLLDEQADQISAMTDPLAERVRKIGGTTLRSIGQIARLQRVLDNDAHFVTPLDMLAELRRCARRKGGAPHAGVRSAGGCHLMIIANAMNACAQSLERFRADVATHVGQVEAGLALGADPAATVAPYVQSAVYASLIPRLDMLKSLGLVWIPGVMAGMMVSGASPVYAGIYQFIIVAMILAASGIAGLVVTLLMRMRAFSPASQLTLRPGERQQGPDRLAKRMPSPA